VRGFGGENGTANASVAHMRRTKMRPMCGLRPYLRGLIAALSLVALIPKLHPLNSLVAQSSTEARVSGNHPTCTALRLDVYFFGFENNKND
jgi:hypothetical protein